MKKKSSIFPSYWFSLLVVVFCLLVVVGIGIVRYTELDEVNEFYSRKFIYQEMVIADLEHQIDMLENEPSNELDSLYIVEEMMNEWITYIINNGYTEFYEWYETIYNIK